MVKLEMETSKTDNSPPVSEDKGGGQDQSHTNVDNSTDTDSRDKTACHQNGGFTNDENIHTSGDAGVKDDKNKHEDKNHTPNSPALNIQDKSLPHFTDPHDIPTKTDTPRTYSEVKVRLLVSVIAALYYTRGNMKTMVFQYLLDRLTLESGQNASSHNQHNACGKNGSDTAVTEANDIQSRVADEAAYFSWCTAFPALATCLVVGALLDLHGRKIGLLIAQLGAAAQLVLVILIVRFNLNMNFFYLAYTLDGIGGSSIVFLVSSLSFTADVSGDKKSRILWIVVLMTCSYVFPAAVDAGVGYIMEQDGYLIGAYTLLIPCALGLFLTAYILPETLPKREKKVTLKKLWNHNTRIVFLYVRDGSKTKRWSLFFSMMIFFTFMINKLSLTQMDTLYQKHEPLCWEAVDIGYYRAFKAGIHGISALLYFGVSRLIGCASDEANSMASLLFLVGSFVMEAFVKEYWQMYMVPIIGIPSVNVDSITRGVMSYLAGPENQGVLFSSIGLIEVFCELIAGTLYSKLYSITVSYMPGAVYFVMAGMATVTFLLYIPFFRFYERPAKNGDDV